MGVVARAVSEDNDEDPTGEADEEMGVREEFLQARAAQNEGQNALGGARIEPNDGRPGSTKSPRRRSNRSRDRGRSRSHSRSPRRRSSRRRLETSEPSPELRRDTPSPPRRRSTRSRPE